MICDCFLNRNLHQALFMSKQYHNLESLDNTSKNCYDVLGRKNLDASGAKGNWRYSGEKLFKSELNKHCTGIRRA